MKKNNIINILLMAALLIANSVLAGTSGKSAPIGEVESILEMNVVPFEDLSTVLPEFRKYDTPVGGVIIAAFTMSNNDSNGFQVSMESEQQGRLVRTLDGQYVSNMKDGDYINYTVNIERGSGGVLGGTMPVESERQNLELTSEIVVLFDDALEISTIDAEINVMINTKAKTELFSGIYKDTLTFVIADL
tara:strand:+ start:1481 stop:2050 length:570 start_codon:yes stop_codon:yes gene_type:complete